MLQFSTLPSWWNEDGKILILKYEVYFCCFPLERVLKCSANEIFYRFDILLLENLVSYFFIFFCIIKLMISSRMRKWNDYQLWLIFKCRKFCKSCSTSSCDSNISILYEIGNIFLTYPVNGLAVWYFFEFQCKIPIEFSERNNPFIITISSKFFHNGFKYNLWSLASTNHKNMRFFSFPCNGSLECWCMNRVIGENWIKNLSNNFAFFRIKWVFCVIYSEKDYIRKFSKYFIWYTWNSIRFVE